jgi:hypothetical protein
MSVSDAFRSSGDDRPMGRLLNRVAHLLIPVVLIAVPIGIARHLAPSRVPSWLSIVSSIAYCLVFMVALLHQTFAGICVRCMQEVPRDAARQALRWRWLLWCFHSMPIMLLLIVVAVASGVAVAQGAPSWVGLLMDAVTLLSVADLWAHHRLRPWCPYCRRWDDGGEQEPSPDPAPSGVKTA